MAGLKLFVENIEDKSYFIICILLYLENNRIVF